MWSKANCITREMVAEELDSFAARILSPMLVDFRENLKVDLEDQMAQIVKSVPVQSTLQSSMRASLISLMSRGLAERSSDNPLPQIPDQMDYRSSGHEGIIKSPMRQRLLQKTRTFNEDEPRNTTRRASAVEATGPDEPNTTQAENTQTLAQSFADQYFFGTSSPEERDSYVRLPQDELLGGEITTPSNTNRSNDHDLDIADPLAQELLASGASGVRNPEPMRLESSPKSATSRKAGCCQTLHEFANRAARSSVFDPTVAVVIIMNAVVIGWQTQYMCQYFEKPVPTYFTVAEVIFCIIFTSELALRILCQGRDFFIARETWALNMFDFLMVALQIIDNVLRLMVRGRRDEDFTLYLSVFRVTRLVRVIRVLRVVGLIAELRAMLASILESTKPLFFALLLLFLMIYSLGVFFTQIALELRGSHEHAQQVPDLERYYGNLIVTMLSLYEAITNGSDWDKMIQPLLSASPATAGIFCFYIAFSILAVMNTITGLFVERALLKSNEDKDLHIVQSVNELFRNSNLNDLGQLTWATFCEKLESPELKQLFAALNVDSSEAQALFMLLDSDSNGCVDPDELMSGWATLRGTAKSLDLSLLMHESSRMNAWSTKHVSMIHAKISWIAEVLHGVFGSSYEGTMSDQISQLYMTMSSNPDVANPVGSLNTQSTHGHSQTSMFLRRSSTTTKMAGIRRSINSGSRTSRLGLVPKVGMATSMDPGVD